MSRNQQQAEYAAGVHVRPAEFGDVNSIWSIYRAGRLAAQPCAELGISRGDVYREFFDLGPEGVAEQKELWRDRIRKSNGKQQVLVAGHSELHTIDGFVWANTHDNGERWLERLYLARGRRGLGFGKKLVEAVIDWHNDEPIHLTAAAHNLTAIGLYESHGFEVVEKRECGYTIAGKPVPQVEMVRPPQVAA